MAKILLIEDDKDISAMITQTLGYEHYTVETAFDGEAGLNLLRTHEYDLAIIDWDLPKLQGIEVCRDYRRLGGTGKILMLTGKTRSEEKVDGLDAGADDYLTKPFNFDELLARVRALLRRGETKHTSNKLRLAEISLESDNYLVYKGDEELVLAPKEFAILEMLMRYPGKVFSAEEIIDRAWKNEEFPSTDVVRTHIMNLRKKLGGGESFIETVRGIGYKIKPDKK